ncbi:unnamed protein product [Rotaria socialis]|uniref:C2H2-type domain-containing protein n=1 Tax=Rotaria socialis TaxID=392032 RepID=A0A817V9P9_9BILA|nr:unnamed protein product [Rotaria socialis]
MMIDNSIDTERTAFICPECSFNGTSLPELISHLNEAHGEETASKSEAPPKNVLLSSTEKRSRRKPAFSHQIISQAPRQSLPLFKQSNVDPGSIHFWNRVITTDKNDRRFTETNVIRDENFSHSNLSPQRPIAPKLTNSPIKPITSTADLPSTSNFSSTIQPIQKNFQCRICHLTYKNFHDCTAHIRRKHEINHIQAGRYVGKLDTNVSLPPSATGHYKIRLKVKSLPPPPPPKTTIDNFTKTYQCKYCSYTTPWLKHISQHEMQLHKNYSSFTQDDVIHNNNNNNNNNSIDNDNGLSALLIDNVQSYGEVLPNGNDEMIVIEEDIDDDEDDAYDNILDFNWEKKQQCNFFYYSFSLWKYQQEINNLSESAPNRISFSKSFKKFQCPHCEHSSPTLTKLKLHIATHINIKPFMCSICGWRANLRWYIQCHAKKRHPNQNFEVLQLSHEEAEQTINAYMRERAFDTKLHSRHDSKHQYQCSLCQFRSNHPRFIEQHIEANHTKTIKTNNNHSNGIQTETNSQSLTNPANVVYQKFSSHPNFNPNRLYYCSLCYRGYRWRYDVKRHHKTMHETAADELSKNRNFHYLEYVPHLDSLISATMSSINNQVRHENEVAGDNDDGDDDDNDDDDDLKISIADARTVDVTDDEAAALLMLEPHKSDTNPIVVDDDHPEDSVIIFEDDRIDKSISSTPKSSSRPSFKPYRCPYCFYRTNWRTDCLRHIRARHKIEPNINGYYEMSSDEAEKSFNEYERTYGFVVSKKVLARFTDFHQIKWEDLKKSIWEKIKDKTGFEQCIYDRLRPDIYKSIKPTEISITTLPPPVATTATTQSLPLPPPLIVTIPNKLSLMKPKRMFTCMDCAFHSYKIHELDKHMCSKIQKSQQGKSHGKFVASLYECMKCSYRTVNKNYMQQHIYLHRLKSTQKNVFYYCLSCGYNHQCRTKIVVHMAKSHPKKNSSNNITPCHYEDNADFSIRQTMLRRSFIEQQLQKPRTFYCAYCPHISTNILEYDHHRSCHKEKQLNSYKCQHCSFSSNSLLYTNQHALIHSKEARLVLSDSDMKNLKQLPVSTIYKEILGKSNRYNCPFCTRFTSSYSSAVLHHIKKTHAGNSNQFHGNLIFGSDMAKEILLLGDTVRNTHRMEIN